VNLRIDSDLLSQVRDKASRDGINLITFVEAALTAHINTVFTGVNTVKADRETVEAIVKASVEASVKTSVEAIVKASVEASVEAIVKASVEASIEPLQNQVDAIAKKLLNLINNPVSQVEAIEALVKVAENKAVEIENHPKAVDKGVQVANTALTGGKGKPITFDLNKSDGSVLLRSVKGTHPQNFKKLSDAALASIGVLRRGDKFYPIA